MSSTSPDRPDATPGATSAPASDETAATTHEPAEATPEASSPTPDAHLLIDPARVRRAPRYSVFLTVGAVVGIVGGILLGQLLIGMLDPSGSGSALLKPGVFVVVTTLGTTAFAMLLAGLVAVLLDRRSLRQTRRG